MQLAHREAGRASGSDEVYGRMAWIFGTVLACIVAIVIGQRYLGIEKEIAAVLYTGFITIFGSVLTIIIGRQNETKAAYERQLRDKKLVIYQDLIKHVLEFTPEREDEESKDVPQKELDRREGIKKLRDMSRSLITWGRSGVQAWTTVASRSAFQAQGSSRSSSFALVRPATVRSSTSVSHAKGLQATRC